MSNLKDTDIDDLFRRASEKYPLRTDSSDWDRMAAALEKDPPPPGDDEDGTDQRRKRRFFWLFLLLPLGVGGLGYYAWHSCARTQAAVTAVVNPSAATGTPAPGTATTAPGGTTAATSGQATARVDRGHLADAGRQINADRRSNTDRQGNARRPFNNKRQGDASFQSNADHQGNAGQNGGFADGSDNTQGGGTETRGSSANTQGSGDRFPASLTQNRQDRLFYDLQREPVDRNYQLKVNVVAPAAKKDSNAAKQKTTRKTKTSNLYVGLLGAPDLSMVKMQSVKGVGNTFGALVGYAFNSHWAIETGAYLDRKKYYTEGQYFNKEIVSNWLTPTDTLTNVNGICYMWEIPLNLRYTFNPESKTRWFATAGFTTYLMTKEKYTYNYEWSGWTGTKNANIKTPSQYPFSIFSLSAGFEQKLGKVGNLRIEPYLRIPLTGMGAGKLPIMSTGINIGITRELWKK